MAPKKVNKKIVILSHSCEGTVGIDDELFQWLQDEGYREAVLVKFPFVHSTTGAIRTDVFRGGKIYRYRSLIKFYKPEVLSFAKDFFYAFYYCLRFGRGADLVIGSNNLLSAAAILARKLGAVKKVAYNIIDYTPRRYSNGLINSIYYWLDRRACYNSDVVMPLDPAMTRGRSDDGQLNMNWVKQLVIAPFGNNSHRYSEKDYAGADAKKIVYMGGVLKNKGADLFVPIAKSLIKAGLKDWHFEVIGGGDLEFLREAVAKAKLDDYFTIYGRVQDQAEMERMLMSCGVAIAPYFPEDKNNFSYYADAAKVKVYSGCGLPVVVTAVPPVAKAVEAAKAGLIADYDADDFAAKIMAICGDQKVYAKYRQAALKFGRDFAWPTIFSKMMTEIFPHD